MIETIVNWLQNLTHTFGPIGIALATFIESFFTPIPSEVVLITAGTIIQDVPTLITYALAATAGSYLGTMPFYVIGRKSRTFMYKFFDKYGRFFFVSSKDIEKSEEYFKKYGRSFIFFGRLIPGMRSLVSIPAGVAQIDFKIYTLYTLAGSMLWNTLLLTVGFILKDQYRDFVEILSEYEEILLIIVVFVLAIYLAKIIHGNIKNRNSSEV